MLVMLVALKTAMIDLKMILGVVEAVADKYQKDVVVAVGFVYLPLSLPSRMAIGYRAIKFTELIQKQNTYKIESVFSYAYSDIYLS